MVEEGNGVEKAGWRIFDAATIGWRDHGGSLSKVIFGDRSMDHVEVHLDDLCIHFFRRGYSTYCIDLERCTGCGEILDRLMQVAGKGWITPEIAGLMVMAVNESLVPQRNFCGWGSSNKVPVKAIRGLVEKNLRRLVGYCIADPGDKQYQHIEWE